jgi:hypothetical protein
MKPFLRGISPVLAVVLCVPVVARAQSNSQRPDDTSTRAADGAGGTMVKKPPVTTDDDIAKLTVRKPSEPAPLLVAKRVEAPVGDPEKAKAEMVALRQEIKQRQRKLELLMKMFVTDEQAFIRNPSGQTGDDDLQMKRRYEQEELRQEAAVIGQLRTRLEVLTKVVEEKTVATTQ